MENVKKTNKKGLIIGLVALLVLVAAFVLVYTQYIQKPVEGAKTVTATIVHKDGSIVTVEMHTDAEYLRGALEEKSLIVGEESAYGLYVKTVDGETINEANQEWWCFTKGGEQLMTGVDQTPIADGDVFEITLTIGY